MTTATKELKTFAGSILKASDRQVTAVVSTGHRDKEGDAIFYGAWQDVIRSGEKPVLYWAHQHGQLPLGSVDALQELPVGDSRVPMHDGQVSSGLLMKATFASTSTGNDALILLKEGHLSGEWSVCFTTADEKITPSGRDIYKVRQLLEVSLCQIGMAWGTRTLSTSAKAALVRLDEAAQKQFGTDLRTRPQWKLYGEAELDPTAGDGWMGDRAYDAWNRAVLRELAEENARPVKRVNVDEAAIMKQAGFTVWKAASRRELSEEEKRVRDIRRLAGIY
jgi:HK97 family phage prohead protease